MRIGDTEWIGTSRMGGWRLCRCGVPLELYGIPRKVIMLVILSCPECGVSCEVNGDSDFETLKRGSSDG